MIKLKAITVDSEQIVELPQSWDEVPTLMFQRIATEWDCKDLISLFSIVSGIDYQAIRESRDGNLERKLFGATQFIFQSKTDFSKLPMPKAFFWRGREIKVPRNLGKLSIGQSVALKQRMFDHANIMKDKLQAPMFAKDFLFDGLISYACSVYLQPLIDSVAFDSDLATDIEQEILKLPITSTYPLGFFLLTNVSGYGKSLKTDYLPWTRSIKNGLMTILSKMTVTWIRKRQRSQKGKDWRLFRIWQ